jgi:hypothetical protein
LFAKKIKTSANLLLEPYHQTYTYDTGNNLTHLSHQASSSIWQQTLAIHPNSNSIALVVIDMVLCSATFVVFGKLIKRIVVVPI